jgi:crossover junction endodeoxyribonuclease RusA
MTWLLEFPAPTDWINSNQRVQHRYQKERRLWRDAAHIWAKARKMPKNLARVHIVATLSFPNRRQRDIHNYMPTIKACVDGLVDYRLIPNDHDQHLTGPDLRPGELTTVAIGWLALDIQEVT